MQRIYISSTFKDLENFRDSIIDFVRKEGKDDFELAEIMEHMYDKGRAEPFLETCLAEVRKSDIYILILGYSGGSVPKNNELTYTELEYEEALKGLEQDKNKSVYTFIYKGFTEEEVKKLDRFKDDPAAYEEDRKRYNRFRERIAGVPVHKFNTYHEFCAEYLKVLYTLKPKIPEKPRDENLLSIIDRNLQVNNFAISYTSKEQRVKYFFYNSSMADDNHKLNFRINSIELNNRNFDLSKTEILTEFIEQAPEGESISQFFVNEIMAVVTNGNRMSGIHTIDKLYEFLEKEMADVTSLVIPIRIGHSLETTDERLKELNVQLKKFILPDYQKILVRKQVIFLINIENENEEIDKRKVELLFDGLNPDSFKYDLGKLMPVIQNDIRNWISRNIIDDTETVKEYLATYFQTPFPKPMSTTVTEARNLIKHVQQTK